MIKSHKLMFLRCLSHSVPESLTIKMKKTHFFRKISKNMSQIIGTQATPTMIINITYENRLAVIYHYLPVIKATCPIPKALDH